MGKPSLVRRDRRVRKPSLVRRDRRVRTPSLVRRDRNSSLVRRDRRVRKPSLVRRNRKSSPVRRDRRVRTPSLVRRDRKVRTHFRTGRPSPLSRTKRQSSDAVDPSFDIGEGRDPRHTGNGPIEDQDRCRYQSRDRGRLRRIFGCRNHGRRGHDRGLSQREQGPLRSDMVGHPGRFTERGESIGRKDRRFGFRRRAERKQTPCYIIDAKTQYADTVNILRNNNVSILHFTWS